MTHEQEPRRWSTDPDEAPELLRGAFSAGRNEGPNRTQMRALAVKLAAASAGGAVAVGTVKAASAGNTIAATASWSVAKIAGVIALAGSVVTGAAVWQTRAPESRTPRAGAPAGETVQGPGASPSAGLEPTAAGAGTAAPIARSAEPGAIAPSVQQLGAPAGAQAAAEPSAQPSPHASSGERNPPSQPGATTPGVGETSGDGPAAAETKSAEEGVRRAPSKPIAAQRTSEAKSGARRATSPSAARTAPARTTAERSSAASTAAPSGVAQPPSELSLLQSAQEALQSRPALAFQLTQQHRKLYPRGEFAQERDALAIQALMRTGDTEQARELAQAFIRAYPSSPHAHRFRESMGIR